MKRKHGFTLVELLVVIAVIALLMSILMPVLKMARDQAMRILCANHIKNLMLAITMYADTHSAKLPAGSDFPTLAMTMYDDNNKIITQGKIPQGGGYWPWDVSYDVTYQLLKNMGVDMTSIISNTIPTEFSTNFYCPANTQQKRYRNAYWNYMVSSNPQDPQAYRVLGFAFLWKAPWNNYGTLDIIGLGTNGLTKDPSKKWVDRTDIPQASETELITDATLSQFSAPYTDRVKWPKGSFVNITVGGIGPSGTYDCSNHVVNDAKAAGGDVGFVDNHVEWRPFSEMKLRHIQSGLYPTTINPNGEPHWWW
jgi:prepilin-type N-terminal cleavage/methylation domain-containing protein